MSVININKARETIAKIEAIQGPIAATSAPTPAAAIAAARAVSSTLDGHAKTIADQKTQLTALNAKVDTLMSRLRELMASKAPASAIARAAETAARKTANDLAAARREATATKPATVTAAAFRESQAKPGMTRAEFQKLSHTERNQFIREGGKLSA